MFSNKVESPDGEGPFDWDRLDLLRGDMFLLGKVVTTLIGPHDMLCILNRGRPIKPLSKGLTHQGIWHYMVATSPRVYILQESFPVFRGYAPLQDSARAFMMDLVIPHNVGFSSSTYSFGIIPVYKEDVVS